MIDKVIAHIEAQREENVNRLNELLRIPSISTDSDHGADMNRAVEWLERFFTECGIDSEIITTNGHPCVLAETGPTDASGPVLLVYGHYDVQPTGDLSLWDSKPFEPTVRDGALYARGAADDKGQLLTHLFAVRSWIKTVGSLPVRVKFVIEGEEEIGSPHLLDVIRRHKERLACDYVVLSDTPQFDENTPAITYGTKGMIYKEIFLSGPKQNLHSGSYGGTVANPGNAMASIIASLRDTDNRVTIPGFYDDVRDPAKEERAQMASLPFDEDAYRAELGTPSLEGERGFTTLERKWTRPTLDVNGTIGGFIGEGASTVIPAKFSAKVSMRVVPDQNPDRISKAFDKAVRAAAPPGVCVDEIKTHASCSAYVSSLDSPGMRAAATAVEAGFGKRPVFIREGGSLPILPLFKDVLGADSLMLGFCLPNCNAHGPNEFFRLTDLHRGTLTSAHLFDLIAQRG